MAGKRECNGTKNLRPLNTRTKAEQKAIATMGGKASGEARRKKRELKELLEIALSQPSDKNPDIDRWTEVTVALVKKAMAGDTKAFELMRDTIGQKPTDKIEADVKNDVNINITVGD